MPGLPERMRPQTLDEVVGNEDTVARLRAWLASEDKHQTLLFTGPIGCGKTTLALIVGRELDAQPPIIFTQYDASHYGDPAILKTILERSRLNAFSRSPSTGWGVRFLDEAHFIPPKAQAALLTIAEKPPKGLVLIFAASEPDKLLPALVSRCLKLEVGPLKRSQALQLLQRTCEREGQELDDTELRAIAEEVNGYPREALLHLGDKLDLMKMKRKETQRPARRRSDG
jgi:DNA polymerase III subunit gamma/tau